MQPSPAQTYMQAAQFPNGTFAYSRVDSHSTWHPVFIHNEGTWDFAMGETIQAIWRQAQFVQKQEDTHSQQVLMHRASLLEKENLELQRRNQELANEVDSLKRISVLGKFPDESGSLLIRVIRPVPVKPECHEEKRDLLTRFQELELEGRKENENKRKTSNLD